MSVHPLVLDGVVPDPVERLAERLKKKYPDRICAELTLPAQPARTEPLPDTLDPRLRKALAARNVRRLYAHQAEAWQLAGQGKHFVVVTPTASGKTLCYNLPVLQGVCDGQGKALYLFPTKALAQDQVAELLALNKAGGLGVRAFTFDGDTPSDARKAVRTRADIVVSNPDMLHQAILPHHTKWAQFFEGLRYVVLDEMHTYRGVFGSHVANLIRRLGEHPEQRAELVRDRALVPDAGLPRAPRRGGAAARGPRGGRPRPRQPPGVRVHRAGPHPGGGLGPHELGRRPPGRHLRPRRLRAVRRGRRGQADRAQSSLRADHGRHAG